MEPPPARPARSHRRPGSTVTSPIPPQGSFRTDSPEPLRPDETAPPTSSSYGTGAGAGYPQQQQQQPTATSTATKSSTDSSKKLQDAVRAFTSAGNQHRLRQDTAYYQQQRRRPTAPSNDPAFAKLESVLRHIARDWSIFSPDNLGRTPNEQGEQEEGDFDPVTLALQLMDDPRRLDKLNAIEHELDDALRVHGQSNYLALDASIRAYHSVGQSINSTQRDVSSLRTSIQDVKQVLSRKNKELAHLETLRFECDESERILDTIESLKAVPDKLESLLSGKRFRPAVSLLTRSLKIVNRPEMREIGALSDLIAYLQSQETSLFEILVDELHSHLYLKSFYCESSWKSYVRGQESLPVASSSKSLIVDNHSNRTATMASTGASSRSASATTAAAANGTDFDLDDDDDEDSTTSAIPKLARFLHTFSLRTVHDFDDAESSLDNDVLNSFTSLKTTAALSPMTSPSYKTFSSAASAAAIDSSSYSRENPEIDSFQYMETLIVSLSMLGKLSTGLNVVAQRVPLEIHNVVEETIDEVQKRAAEVRGGTVSTSSTLSSSRSFVPPSTVSGILLHPDAQTSAEDEETLKDLFWTLYSKLDAVLQGFRVVYEVTNKITERNELYNAPPPQSAVSSNMIVESRRQYANNDQHSNASISISLEDVWKSVHGEIRALLFDYVTGDQERAAGFSRKPVMSVNDVLKSGAMRPSSKVIYKLGDSDIQSYKESMKRHQDALNDALKTSVPGLVSGGGEESTSAGNPTATIISNLTTNHSLPITTPSSIINGANAGDEREKHHPGAHRLLVRSDPRNLGLIRPPTQAFLSRVKQVMPSDVAVDLSSSTNGNGNGSNGNNAENGSSTTDLSFLDEFASNQETS